MKTSTVSGRGDAYCSLRSRLHHDDGDQNHNDSDHDDDDDDGDSNDHNDQDHDLTADVVLLMVSMTTR